MCVWGESWALQRKRGKEKKDIKKKGGGGGEKVNSARSAEEAAVLRGAVPGAGARAGPVQV